MKNIIHSDFNVMCYFQNKAYFGIVLWCFLVCACGYKPSKSIDSPLILTDDVNQVHTFKNAPRRVVSLVPSVTEILYDIGAGDKIIAVTEHCNYPEQAKQHKKKLVVYPNVSTEQIIALKPDVILASTEVMSVKIIDQFKPYNIPVFFVNYRTVKDIPRSMRLLGQLLNVDTKAKHTADSVEKEIENYEQWKAIKRPKIWLVIGTQPLYTAGKNSFMNDVIELAGGENIARSITNTAYPTLTREFILSQRPEYIIISKSAENKIKDILISLYPELKVLPCLQEHSRIIGIEEDILVRPTTRSLQAIKQIKKAIHRDI